jgi:ketosteroid isomerase-like protein
MAQEDLDSVREMLAAFNRGDVEAVLGTFDDQCELTEPREVPDRPPRGFRGHQGIREWMANLRAVAGVEFELTSSSAGDDVVLCELASRGLGQASGVPIEWTTFAVFHLRDGKIASVQAFLSSEEARKAAGLAD